MTSDTPDSTVAPAGMLRTGLPEGPGWAAFGEREDLTRFIPSNALLMFAAQLRLGVEDIDGFAAVALTDDGNDKKCDLVVVERDAGRIVVAQGYMAKDITGKSEGPANKASDLNTAVSWLLAGEVATLPATLRDAAADTRAALRDGDINEIHVWSAHNCPEGANVQRELDQARVTAQALLAQHFDGIPIDVVCAEIGAVTLNSDYKRTQAPILVSEEVEFIVPGGFETTGGNWKAFNTALKATDLRDLWATHGTDLLSPNIRDYLGALRSERNINFGIKTTAKDSPQDFLIFNNGITVLVHGYDFEQVGDGAQKLKVRGLGIVNGGQTTGSIGTLTDTEASRLNEALVQVRFVASSDTSVIDRVVRYNNTQNKVQTTDFRSKDQVQDRLRKEFDLIPDANYRGGRRGGSEAAIKRDRTLLPDGTVAQALAAFHGSPNLAYNETRTIWENDQVYSRFFNDRLSASHVLFAYSLLKSVENAKLLLLATPESQRTGAQKTRAEFFRARGSVQLFTAAVGQSIETILGHAILDDFELEFKANLSPTGAMKNWEPIIDSTLAFANFLKDASNQALWRTDAVKDAFTKFGSMVEATRTSNSAIFDQFATKVRPEAPST